MKDEPFTEMLAGGHPNSLDRTIEVVNLVLASPHQLEALCCCCFSNDEIVRLRTSNALKRISRVQPFHTLTGCSMILARSTKPLHNGL